MLAELFLLCAITASQPADPDSDGDGLSDYQEQHKYMTNPARADSDADGIPDGDWLERREYTYTVRSVVQVIKPVNAGTLCDDYQDGRVLDEQSGYVELELIHYPFNTNAQAIGENRNFRNDTATMTEYLAPGVTTNWDESLRASLAQKLKTDGIDTDSLSDRELARRAAAWFMKNSKYEDSFTTFGVRFEGGQAMVPPENMENVNRELAKRGRTLEEQWNRELFGKGMFETGIHGSCTSTAIYLATGLKALGIPTRTIICIPIIDANDDAERALTRHLTHNRVRQIVERAAAKQRSTWTSHTFNEVFVDGRWRRLNYDNLGQNTLDPGLLGLMSHINTYADHAEANLITWGMRDERAGISGTANPYSCISLSDRFGAHCTIENPPAEGALARMTISKIYWYHEQGEPPFVQMRLDDPQTAGHLIVHVEETPHEAREAFKECYERIDKAFVLRADGQPEIRAVAARGYWIDTRKDMKEFYIQIPPAEFAHMAFDVPYSLIPVKQKSGDNPVWAVKDGLTVTRHKERRTPDNDKQ